ncbi:MAG: transporter, partial [Oscillospiraceae bacterium]|nr:transporter [Oscillospiraceae bacterium]
VQARLYGAKSAVDICVTIALAAVMAFPGTRAAFWLDRIGSVLVALYMLRCGIKTVAEQKKR